MLVLFVMRAALADPAMLLAPTPAELVSAEAELKARVLDAEAIGRAASRLQNATVHLEDPCEGGFMTRSLAFARAWRDAAQRARAQAQRTDMIAKARTVEPLMTEARLGQIQALASRAENQARAWLEYDRLTDRSRVKCSEDLRPGPGLAPPNPVAKGEEDAPIAVWVLSGRLCPGARDRQGVAVVRGPVCMDLDPACSCEPQPVMPGAVLTP